MGRLRARVVATLALLAGACRGGDARDADSPYAARVRRIVPQIERAVGLKFKTPPKVEARSREEVRGYLQRKFEEELPSKDLESQTWVYKRLGLVPDTMNLRAFMLDLLTEQVAGYYDPLTKVLYVVSGAPDDMVGITLTHELIHALQDQYVNLDSIVSGRDDNDRTMAAQAVIEGQATFEQLVAMSGGINPATRLPGGWEQMREVIRREQGSMPVFNRAPPIIQETLLFPYLNGSDFVRRFQERYPGKVPFQAMPASTEQLLHNDAYFATRRDEPVRITLPPLRGGNVTYENNLGEFEIRLFLFEHLHDQNAALRGAAGWDGDRYAIVKTPRGDALAWLTVWDSPVDAAEFGQLLDQVIIRRYRPVSQTTLSPTTRTYDAGTRTVMRRGGELNGKGIVLLTDVPAGVSPDLIDVARVTLTQ
jgi:hypothetical protein